MEEKRGISKNIIIIISIVLLVIVAVGSFELGRYYATKEEKINQKEENNNNATTNKNEDNSNKEDISNEKEEDNKETENNDIKIVGKKYEEFDNIIKNFAEKKALKTVSEYESFYMNSVHSEEPGGWASGYPEMYYFDEDGTYILNISQYDVANNQVLRAGHWNITNGKLVLKEKYILYLVNGTLADVEVPGGSIEKGYVDYDFEVKESQKETTYVIKHIGISEYKESMHEDSEDTETIIPDHYNLDGKDHYSLENSSGDWDYLNYAKLYFDLISFLCSFRINCFLCNF